MMTMAGTAAHPNRTDEARRTAIKTLSAAPLALLLGGRAFAKEVRSAHEEVMTTTRSGRELRASYALPLKLPAPAVVLFHEWWGLNNQIKTVAVNLAAQQGYVALALDLYDRRVAESPAEAQKLMDSLDREAALEATLAWFDWLDAQDATDGKLATMGWCMGGGWSLAASLAHPVDGTVVYYGNVAREASELKPLKGPVQGHFATRDNWIDRKMVGTFAAEMEKAGKDFTAYWYEADHAFANPTSARFDSEDAALAWTRTTDFLARIL